VALFNRKQAVILEQGFAYSLLLLTSGALQAWLPLKGWTATIGLFALAGLPYTLRFLWAPLLDRYVPPILGRRCGWMLVTQVAADAGDRRIALTDPTERLWQMATLALMVAFLSASQDIALDAWRSPKRLCCGVVRGQLSG